MVNTSKAINLKKKDFRTLMSLKTPKTVDRCKVARRTTTSEVAEMQKPGYARNSERL